MCIQTIASSIFSLFVVTDADIMTGLGEGVPGDMEPAVTGEELVGEVVGFKEVDEALELNRIFGSDIGGLADKVL